MGKYKDGNVRPEDAADELHMSTDNFRQCLKNDAFPINIGIAVKKPGNKHFSYHVYRGALDRLKEEWGLL